MDYGIVDITYRSRITLLDMLESVGYATTPYRKFNPKQIEEMIGKEQLGGALRMDFTRETDDPIKYCAVVYSFARLKQTMTKYIEDTLLGDKVPDSIRVDPATTEVIVIVYEPVIEVFHTMAHTQWKKNGLRIRFFEARRLVNDPSSFAIVPKHEKISSEDAQTLTKEYYLRSKTQLPIIRFHEDMQARWLGLVPGDIVKITRPSPSAGEYMMYRVCAP